MIPDLKMRYWQTCQYWTVFFTALQTPVTRAKSFHVSVNQGRDRPGMLEMGKWFAPAHGSLCDRPQIGQ